MKELRCMRNKFGWLMVSLLFLAFSLNAQTGGSVDLSHNVTASGGGSSSLGGSLVISGTVGQPAAGTVSTGGNYNLRGGFWAFQTLAPTAATVNLTGRALIRNNVGLSRTMITLQNLSTGATKVTITNQFGYYHFQELDIGLYLIRATRRALEFDPPEQTINLQDDLANVNFSARIP